MATITHINYLEAVNWEAQNSSDALKLNQKESKF